MLKKIVTIASNGVPAEIHVIDGVQLNKSAAQTTVSVQSYFDKKALDDKLQYIAVSTITIKGLPGKGVDAFEFAELELVKEKPVDESTDNAPAYYQGGLSRYAFAGAEIVA
ncbi:hypothetical protein [Caballeronia sp. dw_19]|uniref:hypothetical protein n=1 Tax=Caballeronia sp. dw_19 TaxID=2719791 RepID=UPI001BD6C889|nr:hypothetical protein [Caballeronia sp. dw_19]